MQKNDGLTSKDKRNLAYVCMVCFVSGLLLDSFFIAPSIGLFYSAVVSALLAILGVDEFAKRRGK